MISREDPFPLVNLEVASLGIPVLCFYDRGGTSEFVEKDAGFVVPYLDIEAMSEKVIRLYSDKALACEMGNRAKEKVKKIFLLSIGAPKIFNLIQDMISRS